jgi:hypothetical protein
MEKAVSMMNFVRRAQDRHVYPNLPEISKAARQRVMDPVQLSHSLSNAALPSGNRDATNSLMEKERSRERDVFREGYDISYIAEKRPGVKVIKPAPNEELA